MEDSVGDHQHADSVASARSVSQQSTHLMSPPAQQGTSEHWKNTGTASSRSNHRSPSLASRAASAAQLAALPVMRSWSMENSVRIVKGEIHNVLSLMRLNRRYNTGARFHREIPSSAESPLVRGLKALHEDLGPYADLQDMDTIEWLRPFLDVVESAETSGPITGGALSSLSKFLNYGFIHMGSPRAPQGVNRICRIVTRCRFERTDHSGDEVVLVRILQVLLDCLRCPAGTLLSDQNVWDMVQIGYDIGRQARLSELLKRTAEHVLMQMILTLFSRFSQLQACEALALSIDGARPLRDSLASEVDEDGKQLQEDASKPDEVLGPNSVSMIDADDPYGMPCMYKVLEFLCRLTHASDATDRGQDSRMLGLSLLNVVLETGGRQISACPALVGVIQHDLSRNLLHNSRTANLQILSLTLRVVFNMFSSVREHMKVQLEVFFNSIHLAESSLPETREMALESLVEFCREPQLMMDIYTNYDCDMQCTNLFEDMVKFLSKHTFPLSGSLNALNLLSLEGLLAILGSLADACHGQSLAGDESQVFAGDERQGAHDEQGVQEADGVGELAHHDAGGFVTVEQLRRQKQHKRRLAIAAERFNQKPTKSSTLEYLQTAGFLPAVLDGESIAAFLLDTPGLDRTAVGTLLGEPDPLPLATLKAYCAAFDFSGLDLSAALRKFLDAFRLPGESQKIARIIEHFAEQYFAQEPGPLANADTVYILSYAIIMLNTDLHNPQVKKKMTCEDFIKMNRGINDNQDLPVEFLIDIITDCTKMRAEIFRSIEGEEIKMKSDLSDLNTVGDSEPRWDKLLESMGQRQHKPFVAAPQMASVHGRDMFLVSWDRIIAAFSVVFETTEDKKVLDKTIQGLHNFAKICAFHNLHDEFNKLINTLSKSLFKFAETAAAQPERVEEPHWVFARNGKVQMAAQAMFNIAFAHADCLRDGWRHLLDYVARLHRIQALPLSLLERDDFVDLQGRPLGSSTQVAIQMLQGNANKPKGRSFFSYLWGGGSASEEDSPAAVVSRLGMAGFEDLTEFVSSLKLEQLLLNTKFLSNGSLEALGNALIYASSRLLEMEDEEDAQDPTTPGGRQRFGVVWESRGVESAIVCLDLLVTSALANPQRIQVLWVPLHKHVMQLMSSLTAPSLAAERTVVNQLRLCLRLAPIASVNADLMEGLRALTALPSSVSQSLADRISVGLLTLLRTHASHIHSREDWRSILSLLQEFAGMAPSASRPAYECLSFLLREDGRPHMTALNFDFCMQTLLGFVDSVLDTQVARQHVVADAMAAGGNQAASTITGAHIQAWQRATGKDIMALMHCLFLRLRAWRGLGGQLFSTSNEALVYQPTHQPHVGETGESRPGADASGLNSSHRVPQDMQQDKSGQETCEDGNEVPASRAEMAAWMRAGGECGDEDDGFGLTGQDEVGDQHTWCMMWMLYVKSVCRIAHDDRYAMVAPEAFGMLEQALLCWHVRVPFAHAWRDCYNQIVFPIVSAKFKSASADGRVEHLCLTTLLVLCKSFRNNLGAIMHLPELHMMWLRLLGLLEALKHRIVAKQRDSVSNDIVVVLKEMLMAMQEDALFTKLQRESGQDMWALTSTVIDAFCPDLKTELMPGGSAGSLLPAAPDTTARMGVAAEAETRASTSNGLMSFMFGSPKPASSAPPPPAPSAPAPSPPPLPAITPATPILPAGQACTGPMVRMEPESQLDSVDSPAPEPSTPPH